MPPGGPGIGGGRRPPGGTPLEGVVSLYPAPEGVASEQLLGCAENALGLRDWLEGEGHELVSTSAREGDELTRELADAEVLVTTPFWPVYVDQEMLEAAPELKLVLTA